MQATNVAKVIDISDRLAAKTAAFLMDDHLVATEAELSARLSVFPDHHIEKILEESRKIKQPPVMSQ